MKPISRLCRPPRSLQGLNNSLRWHRNLSPRPLIFACGISLCPVSLQLAAAESDFIADQMSVRELMRLESAFAVKQAQARVAKASPSGLPPETGEQLARSGRLQLVAIYGVGKKLMAEVVIDHQNHLYLRGRASAVGVKPSSSAYLLRGISGSCVQLERADEAHTLCLQPRLWTKR